MHLPHEAVIGVLAGIHGANTIQLAHQHRREQVIDRVGIVRMPGQHLFEVLDGRVVVQIVEAPERNLVLRVGGPENCLTSKIGAPAKPRQGQHECGKQNGTKPEAGENHGSLVYSIREGIQGIKYGTEGVTCIPRNGNFVVDRVILAGHFPSMAG